MSAEPVTPAALRLLLAWPIGIAAVAGSELGGDMHMPWWLLLIVVGGAVATARGAMAEALRTPRAWPWLAVLTVLGFGLIQGAVWLGENGAETVHQPWRWLLATFVCTLWCEGWAQDPEGTPAWVEALARQIKG